jgi:hypothetical protein
MTQLVFRAKPVFFIRSVGFATFFPQLVGPAGNLFVRGSGMVCRSLAELLCFRYLHKSKTAGGLTLGRIQKRVKSGDLVLGRDNCIEAGDHRRGPQRPEIPGESADFVECLDRTTLGENSVRILLQDLLYRFI